MVRRRTKPKAVMVRDRQFWSWAKISLPKDQKEDAIARLMDRLFAEGLLDADLRLAATQTRVDETITRQIELMPAAFRALHARRGAEMRRRLRLVVTARRRSYLAAIRGRPQRGGASQSGRASGRGAHRAAQQQQQQQQEEEEEEEEEAPQQQEEEEEQDEQMDEDQPRSPQQSLPSRASEDELTRGEGTPLRATSPSFSSVPAETGPMDVDTPAPQPTQEDPAQEPTREMLIQRYYHSLSPPRTLMNLPPWPRSPTPGENASPPEPVRDTPRSPVDSISSGRRTPRSPTSDIVSPTPAGRAPHEVPVDEDTPIQLFSPTYQPPTAPLDDSNGSLEFPSAAIQGPTRPFPLQDEAQELQPEALDPDMLATAEAGRGRSPSGQEPGTPPQEDQHSGTSTEPFSSQEDAIRRDFDPDEDYDNSSEESRAEAPEVRETQQERPQEHPDDLVDYTSDEYEEEERRLAAEELRRQSMMSRYAPEQPGQEQFTQYGYEFSASLSPTEKATSSEGSLNGDEAQEEPVSLDPEVAFYDPPATTRRNRTPSSTRMTAPRPALNPSNSFPNGSVVVYPSEDTSSTGYELLLHQLAPLLPGPQPPSRVRITSVRFDLLQNLLRQQGYDPERDEIYYLGNRVRTFTRTVVDSDGALQTALLLMQIRRWRNEFYVRQKNSEQ